MFSGLSQSQCVGEEEGANMFVDWIGGKTTFITPREETAVHIEKEKLFKEDWAEDKSTYQYIARH